MDGELSARQLVERDLDCRVGAVVDAQERVAGRNGVEPPERVIRSDHAGLCERAGMSLETETIRATCER